MRVFLIVLLSCYLAGCALLHPVPVKQTLYTINPCAITTVKCFKPHPHNLTLLVLPVQANPELSTDSMAYITVQHQIGYYVKNRWVADPASMLLPLIAEALRNTGQFLAVVQAPFVGMVNVRLNTQLLAFQQEYIGEPSHFRLVLAAQLTEALTDRIIAATQFQAIIPAPTENPYGGVIAANQAVQIVLEQLAHFCATATCKVCQQ